jgi:hypothetical protein
MEFIASEQEQEASEANAAKKAPRKTKEVLPNA